MNNIYMKYTMLFNKIKNYDILYLVSINLLPI